MQNGTVLPHDLAIPLLVVHIKIVRGLGYSWVLKHVLNMPKDLGSNPKKLKIVI